MRKAIGVTAAIFALTFAGNCLGSQSASATILLSVYLPPVATTTKQQVATAQTSTNCTQLLNSANQAQQSTCQDNGTQYTWKQQGSQNLTLTVAPI